MQSLWIDPALYSNAPESFDCPEEKACFQLLGSLQIPFLRIDHDPADTIEICHSVEKILGWPICKNLFLCNRQETDFYLLLIPGDKPFKTKFLSSQIGASRLSFASADHMQTLLGVTPGSVTVLALMHPQAQKVRLLIDRELLDKEYISCHPCINTSTLKIKTQDILNRFLPYTGHDYMPVELPWNPDSKL